MSAPGIAAPVNFKDRALKIWNFSGLADAIEMENLESQLNKFLPEPVSLN